MSLKLTWKHFASQGTGRSFDDYQIAAKAMLGRGFIGGPLRLDGGPMTIGLLWNLEDLDSNELNRFDAELANAGFIR